MQAFDPVSKYKKKRPRKIRAEINKIETKKQYKELMKQKLVL
jgi:hypothetical protein